jgi:uncharacterized protein (TIGR01244 family)
MKPVTINAKLSVAKQPALEDFARLAEAGFTTLINNRPDNEDAAQPGTSAEAAAAGTANLAYAHIPVTGATITEADVRRFQDTVADSPGPVLAHCKGGTRSLTLWTIGEVIDGRMRPENVDAFGEALGFDLTAAQAWLARNGHGPAESPADTQTQHPDVAGFFEPNSSSIQYIVSDPATRQCAIIDPVLDFDEKSGAVSTHSADALLQHIAKHDLKVAWILDTHPHADHFSAAHYLRGKTGAPTGIGAQIVAVQKLWQRIYNMPELPVDGSQWDHLFADGETFKIGDLDARVMHSPGHTLASVTYVVGDAAFVHDTLFMPDSGTARTDFPGGSAHKLWHSIQDILALGDSTRLFTGHDYQPDGRAPMWESTPAAQKTSNPHIAGRDEAAFVALREARDRTLPMPRLILHALQVNIRGGRLPEPEANGQRYLKFPLCGLPDAPR